MTGTLTLSIGTSSANLHCLTPNLALLSLKGYLEGRKHAV